MSGWLVSLPHFFLDSLNQGGEPVLSAHSFASSLTENRPNMINGGEHPYMIIYNESQ